MEFLLQIWSGLPDPACYRAIRRLYRNVKNSNSPEARGRRLLRNWLSEGQRAQFDASDFFDAIDCHTSRRYRIYYNTAQTLRNSTRLARSAHAYVRGSTVKFYEWLEAQKRGRLPEGPAVWICGDCRAGNLGPVAGMDGRIAILSSVPRRSSEPHLRRAARVRSEN